MWRGGTKAPENTFSVHRRGENAPCTLAVSFVKVCKKGRGKRRRGGGEEPQGEKTGNGRKEIEKEEVCQVHSFTNATQPALLLIRVRPNPRPILLRTLGCKGMGEHVLLRKVGPQKKGSNIKRQIDRYRLLLLRPTVVLVFLPRLSGAPSKKKSGGD